MKQSIARQGRVLLSVVSLMTLAVGLSACVTSTVIPRTAGSCSDLVPKEWLKGVPGAEMPSIAAGIGDWIAFGNSQTGQLEKSNEHFTTGFGIVHDCEARDKKILEGLTKPWWHFW